MSYTLLIFIKNPQPGRVKTRLARTVGDAEALRIYRFLLEKTRLATADLPGVQRLLFYSDFVEEADAWSTDAFQKRVQSGGDLGERMATAFQQAFAAGASKAIIIGSDCPDLSPALLAYAFQSLDTHDFVLGPTPDGGYYLLGMKQPAPFLFENIAWSTDQVRSSTLEKIAEAGLLCAILPELSDIDTEEDWKAYSEANNLPAQSRLM